MLGGIWKKRILIGAAVLLAAAVFLGSGYVLGVRVEKERARPVVIEGLTGINASGVAPIDFGTFWQVWEYTDKNHLKSESITTQNRLYGAVKGLVGSFKDPYSEFFPPQDGQRFQEDLQGSFGGVGIEIGIRKEQLVVIAPLKGTPGERAGLRAGDSIVAINGEPTADMTVSDAVQRIRGPEHTKVTLSVFRDGWEKVKDFEITREKISIPTLDVEFKEGGDIVLMKLYGFNASAGELFYNAMLQALLKGSQGMVLDLRNNPGGFLDVSVDLAGWFLPRGTLVVKEAFKNREGKEFMSYGNAALSKFPVVILVNKGSASASEILAGALRDQRGVKLIGEKTFGKGTVQEVEEFRDGSSVKLTVAQWVLPSGKTLEGEGLKPDIEVTISDEDAEKGRDPQLEKAIEVLKAEMTNS
jgi:carboxyl-terminal processing protease